MVNLNREHGSNVVVKSDDQIDTYEIDVDEPLTDKISHGQFIGERKNVMQPKGIMYSTFFPLYSNKIKLPIQNSGRNFRVGFRKPAILFH